MKGAVRMSVETLEPVAMDPKLLTEVERQEAVLAELPEDYEFPLFDGRQAIESQRKSAYKNTPRAAREIIDNACEAGAKNVWAVFKRPTEQERAKHERRDADCPAVWMEDRASQAAPGNAMCGPSAHRRAFPASAS
jgi:hypothetical protein